MLARVPKGYEAQFLPWRNAVAFYVMLPSTLSLLGEVSTVLAASRNTKHVVSSETWCFHGIVNQHISSTLWFGTNELFTKA